MAWMLVWALALPHPGGSQGLTQAAPGVAEAVERASSALHPSAIVFAQASVTAPEGTTQPVAAGSRSCCAEDGQTCAIQIGAPSQSQAPDSRRARWLPPKDSFSSAERPRRDRPPRMTA
jgi:hypothetical protein